MLKEGEQYKVVRLLDELLPEALKPTPSGPRLDCRIYFRERPDGHRWAEVVLVDAATGRPVAIDPGQTLPLDGEGALSEYLGVITGKAFPIAVSMRTTPRSERVEDHAVAEDEEA